MSSLSMQGTSDATPVRVVSLFGELLAVTDAHRSLPRRETRQALQKMGVSPAWADFHQRAWRRAYANASGYYALDDRLRRMAHLGEPDVGLARAGRFTLHDAVCWLGTACWLDRDALGLLDLIDLIATWVPVTRFGWACLAGGMTLGEAAQQQPDLATALTLARLNGVPFPEMVDVSPHSSTI